MFVLVIFFREFLGWGMGSGDIMENKEFFYLIGWSWEFGRLIVLYRREDV